MSDIMWWAYIHKNQTVQLKRWFGDDKDWKDDCENNPFVLKVIPPFTASTREEANDYVAGYLNRKFHYDKNENEKNN